MDRSRGFRLALLLRERLPCAPPRCFVRPLAGGALATGGARPRLVPGFPDVPSTNLTAFRRAKNGGSSMPVVRSLPDTSRFGAAIFRGIALALLALPRL